MRPSWPIIILVFVALRQCHQALYNGHNKQLLRSIRYFSVFKTIVMTGDLLPSLMISRSWTHLCDTWIIVTLFNTHTVSPLWRLWDTETRQTIVKIVTVLHNKQIKSWHWLKTWRLDKPNNLSIHLNVPTPVHHKAQWWKFDTKTSLKPWCLAAVETQMHNAATDRFVNATVLANDRAAQLPGDQSQPRSGLTIKDAGH